jgi:hypothetical protein
MEFLRSVEGDGSSIQAFLEDPREIIRSFLGKLFDGYHGIIWETPDFLLLPHTQSSLDISKPLSKSLLKRVSTEAS